MGMRDGDPELLDEAIRLLRRQLPSALSAAFQTSDQDYVGFTLSDVVLSGGRSLAECDPDGFIRLEEAVWQLISGIGWDGVMGENNSGYAAFALQRQQGCGHG